MSPEFPALVTDFHGEDLFSPSHCERYGPAICVTALAFSSKFSGACRIGPPWIGNSADRQDTSQSFLTFAPHFRIKQKPTSSKSSPSSAAASAQAGRSLGSLNDISDACKSPLHQAYRGFPHSGRLAVFLQGIDGVEETAKWIVDFMGHAGCEAPET